MIQDFNSRRHRVQIPMTRDEYRALELYAARVRLPMSRVLLSVTQSVLIEIREGADPLQLLPPETAIRQKKRPQ